MPKYYVTDEIGNKYESMTKDEILESIGAGGERENVFTGEITYNLEIVDYMYTGEKPSDDIILKLLETGLEPNVNHLTDLEIMNIVALSDFTIHYYYSDGELYVSNRNDNSIKFFKAGIGVMILYPNKKEIEYYVKSNKKINDIVWCSSKEFEDSVKDENTTYIVDDENYTVKYALHADWSSESDHCIKADYAIYASEDKSKGTIEERLTALGFKEGVAVYDNNTIPTVNTLKKQGKYVIFNFECTNSSNAVYLTIPEGFRPKEQVNIWVNNNGSGFIVYVEPTGVVWSSATSETDLYILLMWGSSLKIKNVGWEIA